MSEAAQQPHDFAALSAAEYQQWRSGSELYRTVESEWIGSLLPAEKAGRILDLGCGTGLWTCRLAAEHTEAEVVGVDVSLAMLELARRACGRHVRFIAGDAAQFTGDRPADLIIAALSADYIGFEGTACAVHANLAPGGSAWVWFLDPARYEVRDGKRVKTWSVAGREVEVRIDDYSVEGVRRLFAQRGIGCVNRTRPFRLTDGIERIMHCLECRWK